MKKKLVNICSMQELIKRFTNHYIIVDDSIIKDGDYVLRGDYIVKAYIGYNEWHWKGGKKITHSTLPIENKNEWNNIIKIYVHNINNQYIVVDDSEISKGDFVYYCKKITHSTQPIDDKIKTLSFNGLNDLEFYKKNAEENYLQTPLSVLKYITELEKNQKQNK